MIHNNTCKSRLLESGMKENVPELKQLNFDATTKAAPILETENNQETKLLVLEQNFQQPHARGIVNSIQRIKCMASVGKSLIQKNLSSREAFIITVILEDRIYIALGDSPQKYQYAMKILQISIDVRTFKALESDRIINSLLLIGRIKAISSNKELYF